MLMRKIAAVMLVIAILSTGLSLGINTAIAQTTDSGTDDSNSNNSGSGESSEANSEDEEESYEYIFNDNLRLISSSWNDGTWSGEFEADETTTIRVIDLPDSSELEGGGRQQPYSNTYEISGEGTTEVEFTPSPIGLGVQIWETNLYLNKDPQEAGLNLIPSGTTTEGIAGGVISAFLLTFAAMAFTILSAKNRDKWRA